MCPTVALQLAVGILPNVVHFKQLTAVFFCSVCTAYRYAFTTIPSGVWLRRMQVMTVCCVCLRSKDKDRERAAENSTRGRGDAAQQQRPFCCCWCGEPLLPITPFVCAVCVCSVCRVLNVMRVVRGRERVATRSWDPRYLSCHAGVVCMLSQKHNWLWYC